MTIVFLDQFSDPGGAQRCLLDLLPGVRERGWTAHVAAPGAGALAAAAEEAGARFHTIHCGPFASGRKSLADVARFAMQLPRLRREIARLAENCGADLLYVNGPRVLSGVPAIRPVVFHCHSLLRQNYAIRLAAAALGRTSATVIGSCRFVLEPLRTRVPGDRVHVVYNGVGATAEPRRRAGVAGRAWRIGVMGRIAPEKGQAEFLRAARLLPGCQFVICGAPLFGDAGAERYYGHVRQLAVGLSVEFLGWRQDTAAVLADLDLLVVPSGAVEATTRVVLEAAAAGVPVVAFRSGGIPEVVLDGRTGFLAAPSTPEALAARIRDAMEGGPDLLAAVSRNAHAAWRERFTLEGYRRRILSIVESVAGSARPWNAAREST